MSHLFAAMALLEDGWARDVRIDLDGQGRIGAVVKNAPAQAGDERHSVIVPGMGNLHSHAFQRAMAGAAERRGPGEDSFWSWRKVMYDLALSFTPDQLEAVAAQLYMEMLEAGFTRVGEFHYLHHDRDGGEYGNIAELAERIAAAASETGIALTLLPVFYAHSGFGGASPSEGQRRFVNTPESFGRLMEKCATLAGGLAGARLGVAPHSLRAVTPQQMREILPLASGGPIHIHVAEQVKEVEDCIAWSGAWPVEWLLGNAAVDENWTLIHATHMTAAETAAMARCGATAGLCPITEANLGDGIFPAPGFLFAGGSFGIGSDSNVLVCLPGELRQLEYSQRLALLSRNVIADPGQSTGERLFVEARKGGARALQGAGGLRAGESADLLSLDVTAVPFLPAGHIMDQWIFSAGVGVDSVWVAGRQVVREGRHVRRERITARFNGVMAKLLEEIP